MSIDVNVNLDLCNIKGIQVCTKRRLHQDFSGILSNMYLMFVSFRVDFYGAVEFWRGAEYVGLAAWSTKGAYLEVHTMVLWKSELLWLQSFMGHSQRVNIRVPTQRGLPSLSQGCGYEEAPFERDFNDTFSERLWTVAINRCVLDLFTPFPSST